MATNPKIKRLWIKQEKQIVKLLYQKGLIKDFSIDDLYWAEFSWFGKKKYKSKHSKYSYPVYMPEVHYMTTDYWGESDEHSIVSTVKEHLYWEHIEPKVWDMELRGYPPSKFKIMTRSQFIKYLKKMPTKVNNNKIKKVLKTQSIDE